MAPKYVLDDLDEKMFRQAIEKTVEPVKKVVILKDETSRKQRDKIEAFARDFGLQCESI